ncbi:UNVERIFIED_CONTAM: hypothetical protein FKN15_064111 [Acipenser sinensis]
MAAAEGANTMSDETSAQSTSHRDGYEGKCVFCKIVHKEIDTELMYCDEELACFKDVKPGAPHHYLVIPNSHVGNCKSLKKEHIPLVEKMVEVGKKMLQQNNITDLNDIRLGFHWPPFCSIAHLHLHVLAPASQMGFISRMFYRIDSYWFITKKLFLDSSLELCCSKAGSLLVACSHFGSYVCGTDIDYNTIHGIGKASRKDQKWRGPDENIRANLRQYGAEKSYIDVLVSDASKTIWRPRELFDAIITDPPYGIRESTRKTGSQKEIIKPAEECGENHVPVSMAYHLSDIFTDLLNFAAKHLVMGGRLVYWLPVYRPEYSEEIIPKHPCLKLISNCEQTLSSHTARRLITMEKLKEFEEKDELAHLTDSKLSPYQGHNSFREKYFSGVTKKIAKEEANNTKNKD